MSWAAEGNELVSDSHPPWGSPHDRARGGLARLPACDLAAPHTGSGSGVDDFGSVSAS